LNIRLRERLDKDQHSSLLGPIVGPRVKKYYNFFLRLAAANIAVNVIQLFLFVGDYFCKLRFSSLV
jgi:hypothetical protein